MKLSLKKLTSEAAIIGSLLFGGSLLFLNSGNMANADCKLDKNTQKIFVVGQKSSMYLPMVGVGIVQVLAAVGLLSNLSSKKQEPERDPERPLRSAEPVAALHEVEADEFDPELSLAPIVHAPPVNLGVATRYEEELPEANFAKPQVSSAIKRQTSSEVIRTMAATQLSVVFSAPPGCGKTTTELAWLNSVFEVFPSSIVLVVAWKNDDFLGLARIDGAVAVLDGVDFMPLMDRINFIFNILTARRKMPQSERYKFEGQPAWLVLADYFATVQSLSRDPRLKGMWNDFRTKLGIIITVGREFWVGAAVDTHSINVAQLGVPDANIRDCLNAQALGKINRNEFGKEEGGYGAILQAINNKLVVKEPAVQAELLEELTRLQPESDRTGRPIMFTTMGTPRLMLLDDLRSLAARPLSEEILVNLARRLQMPLLPATATTPEVPDPSSFMQNSEPVGGSVATLEPPAPQEIEAVSVTIEPQVPGSTSPEEIPETVAELDATDLARVTPELFQAVTTMRNLGVAPSTIIKEQWGYKGRRYPTGKAVYNLLMERFGGEKLGDEN